MEGCVVCGGFVACRRSAVLDSSDCAWSAAPLALAETSRASVHAPVASKRVREASGAHKARKSDLNGFTIHELSLIHI